MGASATSTMLRAGFAQDRLTLMNVCWMLDGEWYIEIAVKGRLEGGMAGGWMAAIGVAREKCSGEL